MPARKLTPDTIRRATAGLALARGALGLTALLTPRLATRLAGVDARMTPPGFMMLRLFGVREVAIAAETGRRLREGYPTPALLRLGAYCDMSDGLVTLAAARRGGNGLFALGLPTALAAGTAGIVMARALDELG